MSNFEYDARVPLLLVAPGVSRQGARTMALAELVDLYPTLLDLCRFSPPSVLEGVSLVPVLRAPETKVKKGAFTQHPRPAYYEREPGERIEAMGYSVRTEKVRYTEWRDWHTGGTIARELYASDDEPMETRNMVDEPSLGEAQHEAEQMLQRQFPREVH